MIHYCNLQVDFVFVFVFLIEQQHVASSLQGHNDCPSRLQMKGFGGNLHTNDPIQNVSVTWYPFTKLLFTLLQNKQRISKGTAYSNVQDLQVR